jgi:hypothetical protein
MASVLYQNGLVGTFENTIDWETDNLDALLLMTNTTADTQPDATTVAGITTLDESDATDYAHEDVTNPAVSADDGDDEMVWTSDNWVWGDGTALGGDATRDYQGALLVKYVDGSTGDIPLLFVDFSADVTSAATQVTAPAPAEGFLNIGQPA